MDQETLGFLERTGRTPDEVDLVERYYKEQGMFRTASSPDPVFTSTLELDISTVVPSMAGPKRPQDRILLSDMQKQWQKDASETFGKAAPSPAVGLEVDGKKTEITDGAVVIAAITSCTNTSNPSVMLGAGLLAKKAVAKGLTRKPWVKSSLAPGSRVVTDYLAKTGLDKPLDELGFQTVGYGCTTCIGNSGPLPQPVSEAVSKGNLTVAAVLSGNRNFEGRINPQVKANYLASPPLVVAYALAGTTNIDLVNDPLGKDPSGKPVYLKDIWPSRQEVNQALADGMDAKMFVDEYGHATQGPPEWQAISGAEGDIYQWVEKSTYVQEPPFFVDMPKVPAPIQAIQGARVLVSVGDSVTTDHISPAGAIKADSPAGLFLQANGVKPADFNSYGSRRGNDRVMTRGTFANIRLKNLLCPGTEGGVSKYLPTGEQMSIYDASVKYKSDKTPLVVLAGAEYGTGSSRDWAAKGTYLLGIRAVIAVSYERIHRSNLVGMGVLPLEFLPGQSREALGLDGTETFAIQIDDNVKPRQKIFVTATKSNGETVKFETLCRIDTPVEVEYYRHGGILHKVLRDLAAG